MQYCHTRQYIVVRKEPFFLSKRLVPINVITIVLVSVINTEMLQNAIYLQLKRGADVKYVHQIIAMLLYYKPCQNNSDNCYNYISVWTCTSG